MSADGTQLAEAYHANCDGGAAIAKTDGSGKCYGDYSGIVVVLRPLRIDAEL
jgi:hypothetical protein